MFSPDGFFSTTPENKTTSYKESDAYSNKNVQNISVQSSRNVPKKPSHIKTRRVEQSYSQKNAQRAITPEIQKGSNKKGGEGTSLIKKGKVIQRGFMTLSAMAYYGVMQIIFAALAIASLVVEDSWWGWALPGITVANIMWFLATMIGTLTMIISGFLLAPYLKKTNVVLVFILCFSLNWVPVLQMVPWVMLWIGYVIYQEK